MNYSDDHIALAAEYALGTLDADERALVETMMIVDHGFKDVVDAWGRKLAPLHHMVSAIEPPAHIWDRIKTETGWTGTQVAIVPPIFPPEPVFEAQHNADDDDDENVGESSQAETAGVKGDTDIERELFGDEPYQAPEVVAASGASTGAAQNSAQTKSNVVDLASRRRGGKIYGAVMTAVAASLAGVIALQAYRPELLPQPLRIKPKIQTVEVKGAPQAAGAQFVALLQQDGSLPAFVLTVDLATKNFTVRKVGAVPEPGKSYELWLVSDKLQRPRSLGVIGGSDFTVRPALAAYDSDTINKATYAVTVEPEGGSPTGQATGPIVFTGKLFESVPALPAPR